MMSIDEIFGLPDTLPIKEFPTDLDLRGYVRIFADTDLVIHWGEKDILVSDITEFSDHVTFRVSSFYVSIEETAKGYDVSFISVDDEIIDSFVVPDISGAYDRLVELAS